VPHPRYTESAIWGLRAYHHARRIATHLNDAVETGVDVYGNLIRPLLHHQGIDTSNADHALLKEAIPSMTRAGRPSRELIGYFKDDRGGPTHLRGQSAQEREQRVEL